MIVLDHEQGSEEWLAARLGKPSASNFAKLITSSGKPSTSANSYINQLISERLISSPQEIYQNEHMIRGNELEPDARETYEFITDHKVEQVGFILSDDKYYGCSPDGLIADSGGLEIKCPAPNNHVAYLRANKIPSKYWQQVQGCLWITGRDWWDFMSYHPEMPHLITRVERDEEFIKKLAAEVHSAVQTINRELEKINERL